jgi:hypothetical protein
MQTPVTGFQSDKVTSLNYMKKDGCDRLLVSPIPNKEQG